MRTALVLLLALRCSAPAFAQATDTLTLRGHPQVLRLYGIRGGPPVIVSSGDGGWIHLAPHVARTLADRGYFVVGFDVRAYLSSFTATGGTVGTADEPRDYAALAAYAAGGSGQAPLLIGVSEGAGLSVLAATDPATRAAIGGIVALGLPDANELAWRWTDALIYLTHGVPKEPGFSTAAVIAGVAPAPLAAIHSTHDEFVPAGTVEQLLARARDPKRLWLVPSADHRFSDNLAELDRRLIEAIAWINQSRQG